jgi:very-short-patch-repair endonuclease
MYGYLTKLGFVTGVDYYEQYSFGSYVLDFAFIKSRKPFKGLDIETDGFQWHSTPEQIKKDNYRKYKLMKGGWLIERFGETFTIEEVKDILIKHKIEFPMV